MFRAHVLGNTEKEMDRIRRAQPWSRVKPIRGRATAGSGRDGGLSSYELAARGPVSETDFQ